LSQEEIIGELSKVRIIVDHLGLAIGVVNVAQGFLWCLLRVCSRLLDYSCLSCCFLWTIKEAFIEISFLVAFV